jgi:hypothetical protein
MAKKTTLLLIVSVLLIAMFAFVACKQNPVDPPTPQEEVVNKAGEVSANLVYNGDFELDGDTDLSGDGAGVEIVDGEGVDGTHALLVKQTENYGEVMFDLTDYYGRGKSYYVEAKFRNANDPDGRTDDLNAKIDFSVASGVGYEYVGHAYDIPGQYDGSWLDEGECLDIFDIQVDGEVAPLDQETSEYVTLSAIIDAEQIEELLVNQTQLCGGGDVTLYSLSIVFYVGTYSEGTGQSGYIYYLDDVVIKDLNKEIKRTGRTYHPDDPDDPEEEE